MLKIRLLVGLAALVMAMLVVAAPASAEFESKSANGQGPVIKFPEKTLFTSNVSSPPVECKSLTGEPKAEYHVQVKTQKQQGKFFYQESAKKGPHLQLKVEKWGTCKAGTFSPVSVKCNLQVEQIQATKGVGSVYPPGCVVTAGTCVIEVWASSANRELPEVKLENSGENLKLESKVEGISSVANASCTSLGITGGQGTGTFVSANGALELEGVKA